MSSRDPNRPAWSPAEPPAPTDGDELWPDDPTDILSFAFHVDRAGRLTCVPLDPDREWPLDRRRGPRAEAPVPLEGWSGTVH